MKKYNTDCIRLSDLLRFMAYSCSRDSRLLLFLLKRIDSSDLVIIKKYIDDVLIDRNYFDRK